MSRLLGGVGLDLGPTSDELPPPYKRARARFAELNDEILHAVNAAWNSPPPRGRDWVHSSRLDSLRRSATGLADTLGLSEPWGWVDPCNSLTLPFWQELFPDLRPLVCVRDPREVAGALQAGGVISPQKAFVLWEEYYATLLDVAAGTCVITHYDSYHHRPRAELERLVRALGLDSSRTAIAWTAAGLYVPETEEDLVGDKLPCSLQDLYERLLEAARAPLPEAHPAEIVKAQHVLPGGNDLPEPLKAQRGELEHLRLELQRGRGYIEALRAQVEVRSNETGDLRDIAVSLEQQLLERDEELEKLREMLREGDAWRRETDAWRRETEGSLTQAIESLRAELELMKSTRLWRLGQRYWGFKARLRQLLRRGAS